MQYSTNPPDVVGIEQKSFAERFNPWLALLLTPRSLLTRTQMHSALVELLPITKPFGEDSVELAQLYAMLAMVQGSRDETEEQVMYGALALEIHQRNPVLSSEELLSLHYNLALGATVGTKDQAIKHLRVCATLLPQDRSLSQREHFKLREELGFWLAVHNDDAEALAYNQQLLADAEATFGIDDIAHLAILTNLAKTAHELQDWTLKEIYLRRVLTLSRQHGELGIEFNVLRELGVLSHEQGDSTRALDYLQQRVQTGHQIDLGSDADEPFSVAMAEQDLAKYRNL